MINDNSKDNEILRLKDELKQAKQIFEQQKITIQNLQNQINDINSNQKITIQKYKNILNLKEQELPYMIKYNKQLKCTKISIISKLDWFYI